MQQLFQCISCGSPVSHGVGFCGHCGRPLNWGVRQPTQQQLQNEHGDPSMHIIPLDPLSKEPVLLYIENKLNLPAITTDGRLSYLSSSDNLIPAIHDRIKERYPKNKYAGVQSYVMCGVLMYDSDNNERRFIFEIWGFWERIKELDELYRALYYLGGTRAGDTYWNQCTQYLANDPIKTWVNTLIAFLKKELNWKDYVTQSLQKTQ